MIKKIRGPVRSFCPTKVAVFTMSRPYTIYMYLISYVRYLIPYTIYMYLISYVRYLIHESGTVLLRDHNVYVQCTIMGAYLTFFLA